MARDVTVFAIDDSELDLRILRRMFQRIEGWNVTLREFTEGETALSAMRSEPPAIAFMDYLLAGEPAEDLLAQIKAAAPRCPVVVLSGMADEKIHQRMLKGGAACFLEKGAGFERLAQILDEHVRV